jgi:hypothetical protein
MDTTLPSHVLNALEKFGLNSTRVVGTRRSHIDLVRPAARWDVAEAGQ